ncbi:hypothetical protein HORIV_27810 [Vreelandella olivaria]|uniref:Helicase ATP-binding domain-containing protein n=1 Tax=Vreelandella olivaria TaxID=390919 RepID=A0ABM7GI96_9GAMM|nr:hypothetical protein HORIV_27810 [Halomonas olivaria]
MLDNALKSEIQDAYRRVVENLELTPRYGQRMMIAEIARTLGNIESDGEGKRTSDTHVCVLEAGTGTGKTLAYLIAALPIAKARGKRLIISTATVALQEQVLNQDLPSLASHSGIAFRYALAKGRGRYVCVARLDQALEGTEPNPTLSLFEQSLQTQSSDFTVIASDMAQAYGQGEWEGIATTGPRRLRMPTGAVLRWITASVPEGAAVTLAPARSFAPAASLKMRMSLSPITILCWLIWPWVAARFCLTQRTASLSSTKVITCPKRRFLTLPIVLRCTVVCAG